MTIREGEEEKNLKMGKWVNVKILRCGLERSGLKPLVLDCFRTCVFKDGWS